MLEDKKLVRIALWYVLLQTIIWAKCTLFFALFGHGRTALFNLAAFSQEALVLNFWFHEAMHVGIAILALLFGKNLKKLEWAKLAAIVFVAVALHNVGYWLTESHSSIGYSVFDFAFDSTVLFAVVVAAFAWRKFSAKRAEA